MAAAGSKVAVTTPSLTVRSVMVLAMATPAAARSDQVPHPVRRERVKMMQALADEMAADYHGKFIGTIVPVLFETQHEGVADGLTDTYIRVYTKGPVKIGEITAMRLLRLYQDGLWGEPI